jgi:hypothetical protein
VASPIIWTAGFAGTGIDTAIAVNNLLSASVQWVNFATGSDANAGTEPELPVKTTAQAVTNAVAGSTIIFASGNTETITGTVTVNKAGLRFLGFGTGSNRPKFTPASGATAMFNVTAVDVCFESLYFATAAATSGAGGRITCAVAGLEVNSCQVDCGANDQEGILLSSGADRFRMDSTVFTATASRPTRALGLAAAITGGKVINCTIDGATFGWAGNAFTCSSCVSLVVKNLTIAGQSDVLGATTTSYQFYGVTTSAAGKVTLS